MADPMKSTVQEALDHINAWIAQGEKDKAVKGLEEVLHFDPTNADAVKLMASLKGTTVAPTAPVATVTPVVPVVPVVAPVVPPAPVITPVAPAPASMPAPMAAPTAPPAPAASTPTTLNNVQHLSDNVKWMIFAGALLSAIVGGYFFYKNFLGSSEPLSNDIQAQVERQDATAASQPIITPDEVLTPVDLPLETDTTDTPVATDEPADSTPAPAPEIPNEKVKRK